MDEFKIKKVKDREALDARNAPYFSKISTGCYLGFRKLKTGAHGTWIARARVPSGVGDKQAQRPLGDFSHVRDEDRYEAAEAAAREWFGHIGKGGSVHAVTVAMTCRQYVDHLRETKGDRAADDAKARFDNYVLDDKRLAATELSDLTPATIAAWRKSLRARLTTSGPRRGQRRSDSTLNRDMTCFRAALNLAVRDGQVTSDFAWRGKLIPIKDADRRRDVYLDREQRRLLIHHAAPDVADLLRAMCLVPLRPGALAALTAGSYDKRLKTLTIGKDKAGADRKITLPDATAAFFEERTKGKLPGAPLIARSNGSAWDKDAWKGPVREAAEKAAAAAQGEEFPARATCYAIRHSTITDLIHSGLDAVTVAQLSGTSILMIQKHYGHLTQDHARDALSKLAL